MLCNLAWHMVFIWVCVCTGHVAETVIVKYVGIVFFVGMIILCVYVLEEVYEETLHFTLISSGKAVCGLT